MESKTKTKKKSIPRKKPLASKPKSMSLAKQKKLIQNIWKLYFSKPVKAADIANILKKVKASRSHAKGKSTKVGTHISWWTRSLINTLKAKK